MQLDDRPAQNPETTGRLIDDMYFVMHGSASELHSLNGVGADIWRLADGTRTVAEIARVVGEEYDVEPPLAQADVVEFLESLLAKDLVEI